MGSSRAAAGHQPRHDFSKGDVVLVENLAGGEKQPWLSGKVSGVALDEAGSVVISVSVSDSEETLTVNPKETAVVILGKDENGGS